MSDCKWEVGKTYKTTLAGVTATITALESLYIGGTRSDETDGVWWWRRGDGCLAGFQDDEKKAHLTTELADEPQVDTVDVINDPPHYNAGEIECIDAIKAALSPEEFRGFLRANVMKYLWRMNHKGGIEDVRKAEWYLRRLIAAEGGETCES